MTPKELKQRILYQDSNIVVLDKPAGLAVHGGPSTPVHLESVLELLWSEPGRIPRPAHRLDRDTSGCLVLARHDKARARLGRLFGAGQIGKLYWAVAEGIPGAEAGTIRMPLRKENSRAGWRMVSDPAGSPACTNWRRMGESGNRAWLELEPLTGRTHQIRVHCALALGCPVLGDPVYGRPGPLLHLMSRRIQIPYWAERPPIMVTAPVPEHMRVLLADCGYRE